MTFLPVVLERERDTPVCNIYLPPALEIILLASSFYMNVMKLMGVIRLMVPIKFQTRSNPGCKMKYSFVVSRYVAMAAFFKKLSRYSS